MRHRWLVILVILSREDNLVPLMTEIRLGCRERREGETKKRRDREIESDKIKIKRSRERCGRGGRVKGRVNKWCAIRYR